MHIGYIVDLNDNPFDYLINTPNTGFKESKTEISYVPAQDKKYARGSADNVVDRVRAELERLQKASTIEKEPLSRLREIKRQIQMQQGYIKSAEQQIKALEKERDILRSEIQELLK